MKAATTPWNFTPIEGKTIVSTGPTVFGAAVNISDGETSPVTVFEVTGEKALAMIPRLATGAVFTGGQVAHQGLAAEPSDSQASSVHIMWRPWSPHGNG